VNQWQPQGNGLIVPYVSRNATRGNVIILDAQVMAPPVLYVGDTLVPISAMQAQQQGMTGLVPVNVTGWNFFATLKYNLADVDSQAVSQVTTANGGIIIAVAASGQIEARFPASATAGFADSPTSIYYDLLALDPSGNFWTLERGVYVVFPSVTRSP
jgi:hypothetical protein